jgi:hypothetical protein
MDSQPGEVLRQRLGRNPLMSYVPPDMTRREFWRTLALLGAAMLLGTLPIILGIAPDIG